MPVKRTVSKRRLDHLDPDHRVQLETGHNFFHGLEFESEAHRRAVWQAHRETILAEWDLPGRRPVAFWDFDQPWPPGAVSESHAVHLLSDTTAREREEIEADWLRWIEVTLGSAINNPKSRPREHALEWHGVPGGFYDMHAPAIRERLEAERRKWREKGGNGHAA